MIAKLTIATMQLMLAFVSSTENLSELFLSQPLFSKETLDTGLTRGPLCGIYAMCRALNELGFEASPSDYVKAHYVGNGSGSTPQELIAICGNRPVIAEPRNNLTLLDLLSFSCPVVANVRSDAFAKSYDHWVCLRSVSGKIIVYDGARKGVAVQPAEFLATWSGFAIVVSPVGVNRKLSVLSMYFHRAAVVCFIVLPFYAFSRWQAFRAQIEKSHKLPVKLSSGIAIILFVGTLSVVGNMFFGDIGHYGKGIRIASSPFRSFRWKSGKLEDIRKASVNPGRYVLVDARKPSDFEGGHFPNAINIPVGISAYTVKEGLKDVDRDIAIVVYCQSRNCDYDEQVASKLDFAGFKNLKVCEEGWSEHLTSAANHDR